MFANSESGRRLPIKDTWSGTSLRWPRLPLIIYLYPCGWMFALLAALSPHPHFFKTCFYRNTKIHWFLNLILKAKSNLILFVEFARFWKYFFWKWKFPKLRQICYLFYKNFNRFSFFLIILSHKILIPLLNVFIVENFVLLK